MSDIATLFAAGMKSNPYREQAKMLTDSANAIPNDAYGYGAIARIPSMLFAGQKMGEAQQYDEQMNAQATKEAKATRFSEVFTKLLANPQTEGMAVKMWNEMAPSMLGINQKIEAAKLSPNATTVKFQNGGWVGVDYRTQQPIVYDTDQGGWRLPTQGDVAAFQKNTAAEGTPEGRRIYGELQDTSSIPNTPMQDPNNPDVTRSARDIYAGAMKKNLAQESPTLAKQYNEEQNRKSKQDEMTGHITTDARGNPVYATKSGQPSTTKAYIKPEKPTGRYETIRPDPNTGKTYGLVKGSNRWEELPAPPGASFAKPASGNRRIGGGTVGSSPSSPSSPPAGAVPLNKTIGGKPAYQLPDGRIWTP